MPTKSLFLLISQIVLIVGCTASDNTSPAAAEPAVTAPSIAGLQIKGLANFKQTALVLTDSCRSMKFETDRRAQARAAIDQALERYAKALPGGLVVDVKSLSVKLRCHLSGAGNFGSYCAADATLSLVANGPDVRGPVSLSTTRDASESGTQVLICLNAMPAITGAVDKALNDALIDLQAALSERSRNVPR